MLILGVDAAWTKDNPSGVALLRWDKGGMPELIKYARSYDEFLSDKVIKWTDKVSGSFPDMLRIIKSAESIGNDHVAVAALDIPLATYPIISRRICDNEISKSYGGKGAAVHSPVPERPGPIASAIFSGLSDAGLNWANSPLVSPPCFLEVYPHAAIIQLLNLDYRLPYKESKARNYWPHRTPNERTEMIIQAYVRILDKLESKICGVKDLLPDPRFLRNMKRHVLKAYEDVLDAIICAWVGYEFLLSNVTAYGDTSGIIWVPSISTKAIDDPAILSFIGKAGIDLVKIEQQFDRQTAEDLAEYFKTKLDDKISCRRLT